MAVRSSLRMPTSMARSAAVSMIVGLQIFGCGPRDPRIRNRVTGSITYGGEKVLSGEILFAPDGEKRNSGPEGIAIIKDGRFDTKGSRAPGIDGGAMMVEVNGFLDDKRSRVFNYAYKVELGHSPQMTLDIDVPAKKAPAMDAQSIS